MSVNSVTLLGNIGKDPEVRTTQDGRKIANFSLATSDKWRDKKSGEIREKVEWHNIVIYNEVLANIVEKYAEKGSKIYIEGSLQTRKWQAKDGSDRYTTEIVLQGYHGKIEILTDRKQSEYETSVKNTESQNEDMDIPRNVHFMG